ncbi:hypothetical protein [Halorubrum sp. AS12]|uniref:hypothetical protein n=1 Tax=Halorubrum sp. AS12 TaxID=3409687 RepID=UPI003DA79669
MDRNRLRIYIATVLAIPILVVIVVTIRVLGAISSLPAWLGRQIRVNQFAERIVQRVVEIDRAHQFRDDLMFLLEEHARKEKFDFEGYDRWGLLRLIDQRREESKASLRNGEFAISFLGGFVTILAGIYINIQIAGILLTALVLLFSLLVILRIVVTDILSYQSHNVQNESIEMLVMMASWNENQINHGASLVMAAILVCFSSSDIGYQIGLEVVDRFAERSNPSFGKRYRSDN